jgi:Calcium/calmodulin dependent protein kinase II association domain
MPDSTRQELLDLTQRLLESIANGDWDTYEELCDPSLTAFEPEAVGHLVEGLPFHHFYFRRGAVQGDHNTSISSPHVRLMGDAAVVCYVRLEQRLDAAGHPYTIGFEETRLWQRLDGRWRHVHFHRSALPSCWPAG